ncbi:hypothetical protein V1511DRAFT_504672 [Dipodascopsis uninucleata]
MSDLSLLHVYEHICSDKIKERLDGLTTLKRLLNAENNVNSVFNDKAYHKIFESIFHLVVREKTLFVRTHNSKRGSIADRLSLASSVLRIAVERGVYIFRSKTFKALTRHIIQVLPYSSDDQELLGFFEPIRIDYLKSLRALCEFTPHIEHMSGEDWELLVRFLCENLESYSQRTEKNSSSSYSRFGVEIFEILTSMNSLLSVSCAPVLRIPNVIQSSLLAFLQIQNPESSTLKATYALINRLLSYVALNRLDLFTELTTELLKIMSSSWNTKANVVKEQMIITLLYCLPITESPLYVHDTDTLKNLSHSIVKEYSERLSRDQLHIDQITIEPLNTISSWLQVSNFFFLSNERGMVPWFILKLLSKIHEYVDPISFCNIDEGSSLTLAKRRRTTNGTVKVTSANEYSNITQIILLLSEMDDTSHLLAVQFLSFLFSSCNVPMSLSLEEIIFHVKSSISSDNQEISSWAMILLAAVIDLPNSNNSSCSPAEWQNIIELCFRKVANVGTCDAACFLLDRIIECDAVPFSALTSQADSMIASILSIGPSTVSSSSISFWIKVLSRKLGHQSHSDHGSMIDAMVTWIFSRLATQGTENAGGKFSEEMFRNVSYGAICQFILSCCGRSDLTNSLNGGAHIPFPVTKSENTIILEHLISLDRDYELLMYLLLHETNSNSRLPRNCRFDFQRSLKSIDIQNKCENLLISLLDTCAVKLKLAGQINIELSKQVFKTSMFALTLLSLLLPELSIASADVIIQHVSATTKTLEYHSEYTTSVVWILQSVVRLLEDRPHAFSNISILLDPLCIALKSSFIFAKHNVNNENLDKDFEDISNVHLHSVNLQSVPRKQVLTVCDKTSLYTALLMKFSLYSHSISETLNMLNDISQIHLSAYLPVIHVFINHLKSRGTSDNLNTLLRIIAARLLSKYEYERSEVLLAACINALDISAGIYMPENGENSTIRSLAFDIYIFFARLGLINKATSFLVRIATVKFLVKIQCLDSTFGSSLDIPSPRSLFYELLKDSDIRVQYSAANLLTSFFDLYSIESHNQIYLDIHNQLESHEDKKEGMALRVYVLLKLASASQSCLRPSVYNMVEMICLPSVRPYIAKCYSSVASQYSLKSPTDLFKMFSSQIFYMWFRYSMSFNDLEPTVFGYSSRKQFFVDNLDEYVSQLLMWRGHLALKELDATIVPITSIRAHEAIAQVLPRVIVYACISSSVTGNDNCDDVLGLLTNLFGRHKLKTMCQARAADIERIALCSVAVATLTEQDIEKSASSPEVRTAWSQMTRFRKYVGLLPDVQPSCTINAMYEVLETFRNLFEGTQTKENLYSRSVYVIRAILDGFRTSLVSLHSCAVLRRLSLYLAINLDLRQKPYVVSMIMHAIIPLIRVKECIGDVCDITRFLLTVGFVTATPKHFIRYFTGISYYISELYNNDLKTYKELNSLKSFRDFLQRLVQEQSDSQIISSIAPLLLSILNPEHQTHVHTWSNSNIESVILNKNNYLDGQARLYSIKLLGHHLNKPDTLKSLARISKETCVLLSSALMEILREYETTEGFKLWAVQILGKAYTATGNVHKQLSEKDSIKLALKDSDIALSHAPVCSVTKCVIDLLDSNHLEIVSLAESALRAILTHFKKHSISLKYIARADIIDALACDFRVIDWSQPSLDIPLTVQRSEYGNWSKNVAIKICNIIEGKNHAFYKIIGNLISQVPDVSPKLIPFLFLEYYISASNHIDITDIFNNCFRLPESKEKSSMVILLLHCFIFLQRFKCHNESNEFDRFCRIANLDYYKMLEAAIYYKMYHYSLLICENMWNLGYSRENLSPYLISIYKNIDDPDIIYGVPMTADIGSIIEMAEFEHDNWKTLSYRGAQLDSCRLASEKRRVGSDILSVLSDLGMNGLCKELLNTPFLESELGDKPYEVTWKLTQWDLPPSDSPSLHSSIYNVLRSLNETTDYDIKALRQPCLTLVRSISTELISIRNLRDSLLGMAIVSDAVNIMNVASLSDIQNLLSSLQSYQSCINETKFENIECLLLADQKLLNVLSTSKVLDFNIKRSFIDLAEVSFFKMLSEAALTHGDLQKALLYSMALNNKSSNEMATYSIVLQRVKVVTLANVLRMKGEIQGAIKMLRTLSSECDTDDRILSSFGLHIPQAMILSTLGKWISDARQERPDIIYRNYLEPSIEFLDSISDGNSRSRVYHTFAEFCDHQLKNNSNTEDFKRIERLRYKKLVEIQQLENFFSNSKSNSEKKQIQSHLAKVRRMYEYDNSEYNRFLSTRETFLQKSITFYLLSLASSDTFLEDSFKFCSLWLGNSGNDIANRAVSDTVDHVPSGKLIGWINQLSSRLSEDTSSFQKVVWRLVLKMCRAHPYHSIYQLFSLKSFSTTSRNDTKSLLRVRAANKMWDELQTDIDFHKNFLYAIEQFCEHAVTLALFKFPSSKRQKLSFDHVPEKSWWMTKLPEIGLPPPTMHISVAHDSNYSKVPKITSVSKSISLASGLSQPKICVCCSESGHSYKMLVKGGNDDLRQDAIMEQVFDQVNQFFQRNDSTKNRGLHVRTYKVIPLSHVAGIIEFVPHTIALNDVLQVLHLKYYPKDWDVHKCREVMKNVQNLSVANRLIAYESIESHLHPVLRHFFLERYRAPSDWFEKRTSYTRATAAISMLGHVLGLGDRHCNNILLDGNTGEPVHIDLGVAFEQGKLLPIPETVPFRLSRDIVDAMGINGIEGIFKRCCTFTLDVLRQEADSIMTILDVLRYDPLYLWTLSPLRKRRLQELNDVSELNKNDLNENNSNANDDHNGSEAERALLIVSQKLSKSLSAEAVVNELVQEACDSKNLSLLYCGWSPFF